MRFLTSHFSYRQELLIVTLTTTFSTIMSIATDAYLPSLPALTHAFGTTEKIIQLTITLFLLGATFAQLIYGPLSDAFGRRRIILFGLWLCVVGSVMSVMAISPVWLILARLIQGAGAGVGNALYRAVMRDVFSGSRMAQVASYTTPFYTVAWAIAPVLGGYIQSSWGWRVNLIVIAVYITLVAVLISFFLPETNRFPDRLAIRPINMLRNYWILLKSPVFTGNAVCASLTFATLMAYLTISPFLLQNTVGLSPVEYGWSTLSLAGGLALGGYINASYVMRYGENRMMYLGMMIIGLCGIFLLCITYFNIINTYLIMLPAFFFSLAGGFIYTNAMSKAFVYFPKIAGTGGALYGAIQISGTFFTILLVVVLPIKDQWMLGMIFLFFSIMMVVIMRFYISRVEQQLVS